METIKVNMNPNPLDVQTIHASQGDTEARQWEFELHNNGDVIDASEISDQLVFKAYKGGTEQILPENTSTPTTSPFLGDIRYPQGLLTDQEFTYRQSPTESDGLAKITDIKGNTLVWNQLVQNGNFADTNSWDKYNCTLSVSDNVGTVTTTGTSGNIYTPTSLRFATSNGDKILLCGKMRAGTGTARLRFNIGGTINVTENATTTWQSVANIVTAGSSGTAYAEMFALNSGTAEYKDVMIFNLTKMFGRGNEPSTVEEFTSLFPLSYYSYNQGSLLSFNGNGIKTVGKNLMNSNDVQVGKAWNNTSNSARATTFVPVMPSTQYVISISGLGSLETTFIREESSIGVTSGIDFTLNESNKSRAFTTSSSTYYLAVQGNKTNITKEEYLELEWMLEFGSVASEYEPYTSSTTSLPISTYFPTGMKSAGSVYDELTPKKAITRIGVIDLGSLTWTKVGAISMFYAPYNTDGIFHSGNDLPNIKTSIYSVCSANTMYNNRNGIVTDDVITVNAPFLSSTEQRIIIADTSFSDVASLKSSLNGVYLYYELATPTETSFTTASLVTENAEIPLSNEDGVLIGKCTEQLSENPGFIDAKIKLSDADGTCYSNKIQLHVERKP